MKKVYNGVKAEPKFLRDPTSLESISSGISRLSGYVTSNLSKRRQSAPVEHYTPFNQDETTEKEEDCGEPTDTITFAAFEQLNIQKETKNCLLLGYQDGFQVWDISNPDNIHELCSIREKGMFNNVTFLHCLANINGKEQALAVVCEAETNEIPKEPNHSRRDSTSMKAHLRPSVVKIYSLRSQSVIKEINEFDKNEDTQVTCIKSNHKIAVLGCLSQSCSSIHLYSANDFSSITSPLTDVYHENGPVFTLGTRFIAYATNAAVLNSDPVMSALVNKGIGYTGIGVLQGEKDVKGAAKDIAKEVASGMKSLGELGYSRLSNYFNNNNNNNGHYHHHVQHDMPQKEHLVTTSNMTTAKKQTPMGMIMIRDLQKLPYTHDNKSSSSASIIAHFRPHSHAISCLTFNPAGTLLLSASKQGHTFHVFSILTSSTAHVAHLYSLSRGITDAHVVDCQFSVDSTWCAVSTARGTTHLYAINPYGGRPDINSHMHSKVNNPPHTLYHNKPNEKAVNLNSIIRIKQRRKMTLNEALNDETSYPLLQHNRSSDLRAKIATVFVYIPKSSNILNSSVSSSLKRHSSGTTSKQPQQQSLGSMLSSLGSSLPYNTHKWMVKPSDPLMFDFDEEYYDDDDKMMLNDDTGYQDMYSFHPDGYLTLHRCYVGKVVYQKRENNRTFDKTDFSIKEEGVAEWCVARNSDWEQVKLKEEEKKISPTFYSATNDPRRWLSNAEINTHHADKPALWTHHQFSFQTYNNSGQELERLLNSGLVPPTKKIILLKGIPEPISSRLDRLRKISRVTDDDDENLDDALAELEDNISKAIQTSLGSPASIDNSPSSFKHLSSSNAVSPSTPRSLKKPTVSFEDAYLINLASDPMQHSSLIHFDDSDDEVIQLDHGPDGDNEMASPSDSFFGGHFG